VEELFGLNREELRLLRYKVYNTLSTFVQTWRSGRLEEPLQSEVETQIRAMLSDEWEYAAMSRYFVRTAWGLEF
jgi:hypothetical protein